MRPPRTGRRDRDWRAGDGDHRGRGHAGDRGPDPDTSVDHSTLTNDETDSGDTRSGWVVLSSSEADYVSWVEVTGQLTGTVQIARLDDTGTSVKPASLTVTGVRAATKLRRSDRRRARQYQALVDAADSAV